MFYETEYFPAKGGGRGFPPHNFENSTKTPHNAIKHLETEFENALQPVISDHTLPGDESRFPLCHAANAL